MFDSSFINALKYCNNFVFIQIVDIFEKRCISSTNTYVTRVNYKDNNLNENKIVITFESYDELNNDLNVKMVN